MVLLFLCANLLEYCRCLGRNLLEYMQIGRHAMRNLREIEIRDQGEKGAPGKCRPGC
jgi:hypothetical protein